MTAVDDYLAMYGDYPPSRFDLDPYELGIWPDYCPVCDGTGIYRLATFDGRHRRAEFHRRGIADTEQVQAPCRHLSNPVARPRHRRRAA